MPTLDLDLSAALKLLAEPTRLRILALLDREELSVGELSSSLGMAQSRVSNHLRLLREAELLVERHAGTSTYLRLASAGSDDESVIGRLWPALRSELDGLTEHAADLVRLETVLARRQRDGDFFDRVATDWDKISGDFETGQARPRALAHLLPRDWVVADLGCGTGYLASSLLGVVGRVLCVDRSQAMLDEAKQRAARVSHPSHIEFRCGELDALPIDTDSVDGAIAGMVLHHLDGLDNSLGEMHRIVRPGGSVVVIDLAPHRESWMHTAQGDRHLGLEAADVVAAFRRAGFEDVVIDPVDDRYRPTRPDGEAASLPLFIVRGRVPSGETESKGKRKSSVEPANGATSRSST